MTMTTTTTLDPHPFLRTEHARRRALLGPEGANVVLPGLTRAEAAELLRGEEPQGSDCRRRRSWRRQASRSIAGGTLQPAERPVLFYVQVSRPAWLDAPAIVGVSSVTPEGFVSGAERFAPADVIRRLSPEEAADHIARTAAEARAAMRAYGARGAAIAIACRPAPASAASAIAAYDVTAAAYRARFDRVRDTRPSERAEDMDPRAWPEWAALIDAARAAIAAGMPHDATSSAVLAALGHDPAPGRLSV